MKILESPLLGEFIAYLKSNWSGRSRVDLRRRRLRQLVTKLRAVTDAAEGRAAAAHDRSFAAWLHMLRTEALRGQQVLDAACCDAAAVAGSTRRFLAGMKELVVSSPDVDLLAEAVEELERLAGPGGDLDLFVEVLRLNDSRSRAAAAMDVDGCRPELEEEEARGNSRADCAVAAAMPLPGRKRTRACCGSVADRGSTSLPLPGGKRKLAYCSSFTDRGSTSLTVPGVRNNLACCSSCGFTSLDQVNTVDRGKRRVLAWSRPRHWLPTFRGLFGAPREPPPPQPQPQSARTVALALSRVRGRLGKPTRRRRQPTIGRQLARLSL